MTSTPSTLALDWGQIDAQEVNQLYRAFLGRDAEPDVVQWFKPRPLFNMVWDMSASEELGRQVLLALVQQRPIPHASLADAHLEAAALWLTQRLGLPAAPGEPLTWPHLLSRLYALPALSERMLDAHGSLFTQAQEDLTLLRKVGRRRLAGKIEFVNREFISGWASDLSGATESLPLEIRHQGRVVATCFGTSLRPDVLRHFGGNGMAGFRARWNPTLFAPGQGLLFTLHEASTGVALGNAYHFENSFFDQLAVSQRLAKEFEEIRIRLDHLAGMVPQSLGYSAFPLEHYDLYRRTHRVPPPPHGLANTTHDATWPGQWRTPAGPSTGARPAGVPAVPTFAVLVDGSSGDPIAIRRTVDSLRAQSRPADRVLIAGSAASVAEAARLLAASDPRVSHLVRLEEALVSLATTDLPDTADATPPWVVLLEAGDLADPQLLAWLTETAAAQPQARGLYWDEDRIEHLDGAPPLRLPRRLDPLLRRPFCADAMLEFNGVGTSLAIRSDALYAAAERLAPPPTGASEPFGPLALNRRELLIWAVQGTAHPASAQHGPVWHHIPQCLHSRSQPATTVPRIQQLVATASAAELAPLLPPAWQARRWLRVADPLWRQAPKSLVRWTPAHPQARISVIIPTRDHADLVKQCVDSLRQLAERPQDLDIMVMDNGSTEPASLAYLSGGAERGEFRVLRVDEPFNWSRLNNLGAQAAEGELLLFLNNDTRMLTPEWDSIVRGLLERQDVGAVGARLLYEDMTLQHAGVIFGYEDFVGHEAVHRRHDDDQALTDTQLTREVSAVTGAFIACRAALFKESGGFEAHELSVTFNDVEWCMRVGRSGRRILYAPLLSMVHYESKSRGFDFMSRDKQARADYERQALLRHLPFGAFSHDPFRHPGINGWANEQLSLR